MLERRRRQGSYGDDVLAGCRAVKNDRLSLASQARRLRVTEAKWLKAIEDENCRLKRAVANVVLDNTLLYYVAGRN